jgi:hypothetical protein
MQIHKKKLPIPNVTCYKKSLDKEKFWIQKSNSGTKLSILKTNNDFPKNNI